MLARSSNANDVEQAVMASIQALNGEASPTPLLAPLCALREFIKRNVDAIKPKVDSILDRLNGRVLSEVVEPAVSRVLNEAKLPHVSAKVCSDEVGNRREVAKMGGAG
jgi:hypothetical protein